MIFSIDCRYGIESWAYSSSPFQQTTNHFHVFNAQGFPGYAAVWMYGQRPALFINLDYLDVD